MTVKPVNQALEMKAKTIQSVLISDVPERIFTITASRMIRTFRKRNIIFTAFAKNNFFIGVRIRKSKRMKHNLKNRVLCRYVTKKRENNLYSDNLVIFRK